MPWEVSGVVEKRKQFLSNYCSGEWTMSELCRLYKITRPTGYALLRRYAGEGEAALHWRSRAAWRHPNQTPRAIEELVLELRRVHPRWGPRTLKKLLEDAHPELTMPAASTIGELLDRGGLTQHRRKRRKVEPDQRPFVAATAPNHEWAGDFKGWMRTTAGERIDPLTISDTASRYLLRCHAVEKTDTEQVKAIFAAAFREYGMPGAIRTDNGAPFASCAVAGLSRLSLWWMKLGIRPQRIAAGHPEQNGRHERMHRTMKEAVLPAADRRAQQRAFDAFRQEYNELRPHQALAMQTPAQVYQPSLRRFPERVPEPEYASAMKVRRVQQHGQFYWDFQDVFLSKVLAGERIGVLPIDDRYHRVYFAMVPIARLDMQRKRIERLWDEDLQQET